MFLNMPRINKQYPTLPNEQQEKQEPEEKPFLDALTVSRLLRIHIETFYRLSRRGKIPGAVKIGGEWRVNPEVFWKAMRAEGKQS